MEIAGDLSGIRTSQLQELKSMATLRSERSELINLTLAEGIARLTSLWNREIAVYVSRSGKVEGISVGDHASATLPPLKGRIRGNHLRCIHTHPNGSASLSTVDLSALDMLSLESITVLAVNKGRITGIQVAFNQDGQKPKIMDVTPGELRGFDYLDYLDQIERSSIPSKTLSKEQERAFLIGLNNDQHSLESLDELAELARSAGVNVVGRMLQSQRKSQSRTYIGSGKLVELGQRIQETHSNVLICDDELSPLQLRTLEEETGIKVLDRTTLILDIFAQRASSSEGKLQVELAQLKHLLPHLYGLGGNLSRLGGGVGTRGPGETKLELDRRRVRQRINLLEQELARVRQNREVRRQQRIRSGLPLLTLVGYTNAGKTTFLRSAMEQTGSRTEMPRGEDKLFATLDPIVRRISLKSGQDILLSDTVGFIQKLPHHLLKAFLATLEEVQQADILIHILDASHYLALERALTVRKVLRELGCEAIPIITVLNKIDKVNSYTDLTRLGQQLPNPVYLSLLKEDKLETVWHKAFELLAEQSTQE